MKRLSLQDRLFDGANYTFLTIILLLVLYPLWFVVIASFSEPDFVNSGRVWLLPRGFNLDGYSRLLDETRIWSGYLNSFFYLITGTAINLLMTIPAAYALSRKDFIGRNFLTMIITVTMFFSGGLIPLYLVVKNLGILNTRWSIILPQAVIAWNLIVTRTFFQSTIPDELLDASRIDGCSNTQFFIRIVLPLSKAIMAVMVLYYGINHWNQYFNALIYLRTESLYPLQLILREILIQAQIQAEMLDDAETAADLLRIAETIKYAVIIIASLPLLILYPFLQKYFVEGVMIGAIKG